MQFDESKVDEAVLALLYLTLQSDNKSCETVDLGIMQRLHQQGFIDNPNINAESILLTKGGRKKAKELFETYFCKSAIA